MSYILRALTGMQAWTHRRKVREVQARLLGMLHSLAKEVQSRCRSPFMTSYSIRLLCYAECTCKFRAWATVPHVQNPRATAAALMATPAPQV